MVDLINDGSLIGLWPLHEASGAPTWKNYSPARAGHPSGVTFDLHVHTADVNGIVDDDSAGSPWPGQEVLTTSSGQIKGLKLQGQNQRLTTGASAPFSKMLILGNGTRVQRSETLGPAVAGSGFSAGFWVYPMSDGWINAHSEGGFSPVAESWKTGFARTHGLIGQWKDDIGWYLGISGQLTGATPNDISEFGGPHQLRGFLVGDVNTGAAEAIDEPIETNRYTHLSMTYEYVDGNSNVLSFYKDGVLVGTQTTNRDIVFDNSNTVGPDGSVFNIGGGNDGTHSNDTFEFTNGWNHLVSGVYLFRRVLSNAEMLEMHERGGLQPNFSLRDNATEVSILDTNLVAYVEGKAPGWIDCSRNSYNFISDSDPGDRGNGYTWDPGPFNTNRAFGDGNSASDFVAAPSGATFALAEAPGGFTIFGVFQPYGFANFRDDNMMFSMGSVSTATAGPATPGTVSSNTLGMSLSYFSETGFGDRVALEVFPVGDGTDGNLVIRSSGEQIFRATTQSYQVVYDAASNGIALYLDGYQAGSGTLSHNFQDHMLKLAGSGFPLMFMNGIQNQIADSTTKGVHANGGDQSTLGSFALFSKPLRADESRYLAQSGIDTSSLWRTRHDPRLMGYWPCDSFDIGDVVVEDKARSMSPVLGHLSRGDTFVKWDRAYNRDNLLPDDTVFNDDGTARVDLFGSRTTPDELQSFGNLGITSGIFSPHGASPFTGGLNDNNDIRNTPFNSHARWRPATEQSNLQPQSLNEYIISFEVTPSGDIPALDATEHGLSSAQKWFNSKLHVHGNLADGSSNGEATSFLTTQNANNGSGVTICFVGREGSSNTTITPIISGTLPYGVPTRVLFHSKFQHPYFVNEFTTGSTPVQVSLWIDGNKVNERVVESSDLRLWSNQIPDESSADWLLQFGGYAANDLITTQINTDGGLGEIYMREIFLMRGIFETNEISLLASNGIQNTSILNYANQLPTTQVSLANTNLEGYWRFNGFDGNIGQVSNSPGGSGTTDLSSKNNHLDALAQRVFEQGTSVDLAETMRAIPGPHRNSDIGIQCSGFHNASIIPANIEPNMVAPFAVSGAGFNNPANGFSVGFLMAKRDDVGANVFDCLMSYGVLTAQNSNNGNALDTTLDPNRGWAIGTDDSEQVKIIISTGGNMYLDAQSNAANSGQIVCGVTNTGNPLSDLRDFNKNEQGNFVVPRLDYWNHYCWTYDATERIVKCYLNGLLVDRRVIPSDRINPWTGNTIAPQTPVTPECRMITFRSHMSAGSSNPGGAWSFTQRNMTDVDSVMTDAFYFSDALTEQEVRYIALNGIDRAVGTVVSGVVGGYVRGQDTGSGLVGGYFRGQDIGSGLVGGYMPGGIIGSGSIGGYVSGVVFADGTIGGWIRGLDDVSGILGGYVRGLDIGSGSIAGYIQGQEVGSGHFGGLIYAAQAGSGTIGGYVLGAGAGSGTVGGFVIGGLQSNIEFDGGFIIDAIAAEDFDAQIEIAKTASADFDAKVVIFQNESPPLVDIVTPNITVSGLVPPFNQYFIGKASGQQGKSITKTRWNFGDFTSTISVAESGAGCYPVQHNYTGSGFYIAKFEAIDSDGVHASATRIVNAASGIDPVIISLSGVPRSGNAELIVDFETTTDILPNGVSLSAQLLNFDDGQSTISFNPTHVYNDIGTYKPIWIVRDSRGVIWSDSLEAGNDFLRNGGY